MTSSTGIGSGLRAAVIIMALGLGLLASLATVAAFFGNLWWGFDLFANFRWHLLWAALIAAIAYALASRGWATIAFIVAAVVNAFVLAPLWFGSQPDATGEAGTTIVQVDMYGGSSDDTETLRWLFDSGADLIIAQGVTADRLAPLAEDGSPYRVLAVPQFPDRSGIVVLATEDYAVTETLTPEFAQQVLSISVPANGGSVDIVTAWGELATDGRKADALEERLATVTEVVRQSTSPVAVVGNLGATRFTAGMRSMLDSTGLRDATEGKGYLSTWPVSGIPIVGGWIGIPIDVVLMGPEVTPLELTTGPDIGVSHLPVTVVVGPTG